jgi:plastocyanin
VTKGTGIFATHLIAACALAGFVACGGDGDNGPTGPDGGSGAPGPSGATITIANGRVTPSQVTVAVGQSVTFVNNDGQPRNVTSNPHPVHTDCPQINVVGGLSNGQTKLTNAFPTARTCGFHNHDDPDNANFRGQIVIQ